MKTISFKALVACLGMFALFTTFGCNNDDDAAPDKGKLLTSGSWQLSAMTVNPPLDWFGTPVTDLFSQLPACLKDDRAIFKTNGTVTYDEGPSKCEPTDPQTTAGTWTFNTDQTVLSVTTDGETDSWNISTLTDKTFKMTYTEILEGVTYTFSVTFVNK